jgi:hypothetical protein
MAPRDQAGPWHAVELPVAPVELPVAPAGAVPDDAGGDVVPELELVWLLELQPAVISRGTAASSGTKREYRRRARPMDDTIQPPSAITPHELPGCATMSPPRRSVNPNSWNTKILTANHLCDTRASVIRSSPPRLVGHRRGTPFVSYRLFGPLVGIAHFLGHPMFRALTSFQGADIMIPRDRSASFSLCRAVADGYGGVFFQTKTGCLDATSG